MSTTDKMKWRASFFLWGITVGYYIFLAVWFSMWDVNVYGALGLGALGGTLTTISVLVAQHWYRKKVPTDEDSGK